MKKYGLIGYPLGHSFSKKYFSDKFDKEVIIDSEYYLYPLKSLNKFVEFIEETPELLGLSVTIPYKEKIIPFLNRVDKSAKEIGAVNTIKIERFNKNIILSGYNTDVYGFEESLKPLLIRHKKALVLGTGGASKAVTYVLNKIGIEFKLVSRFKKEEKKVLLYSELNQEIISKHSLIVNTTPLGMYPSVHLCPDIPYKYVTSKHLFYDLVYNPDETLFLNKAKLQGAVIKNGLEMLHLQAEKAWRIFKY